MESEQERVDQVISAGRNSIHNSVVGGLALGLTYCEMARLTSLRVKRLHLFALASEALTRAEAYVTVAPPELVASVLEYAQCLRVEIGYLNENANPNQERIAEN